MPYIGYCENLPIKPGDVITIPRGIRVKTMRPGVNSYITKRSFKTKVYFVTNGFSENMMGIPPRNPMVEWAGSGGYWCEADINDILREAEINNG